MKLNVILFLTVVVSNSLSSQNLVVNGDLEGGVGTTSFFSLPNWDRYNGSPDVHNPDFNWAQIEPKSGEGFIGFYQFGTQLDFGQNYVREFIRGELTAPLEAGKSYEIAFWIRPSLNDGLGRTMSVNSIGALFTAYIPEPDSWEMFDEDPQFEYNGEILSDLTEWVKIKGCFKAEGGESYITIGNFRTDNETQSELLDGATWEHNGYYLIDDITLTPLDYELMPIDPSICSEGSEILSVQSEGGSTVTWGDGTVGDSLTVYFPGQYELNIDFGHCVVQDQITLFLAEPPVAIDHEPLELCSGESIALDFDGEEEWIWFNEETTRSILVSEAGEYLLTKWNNCGTAIDNYVVIDKDCSCLLWMPNAFTPDQDGLNENFGPEFDCLVEKYTFTIYDKWGKKVFSTTDPLMRWNGNGMQDSNFLVQAGVYNWIITYTDSESDAIQINGSVFLIR